MIVAHKVRLDPTLEQSRYFARACGVARFSYNWALVQWQQQYRLGHKPSETALRRLLNERKDAEFPWMAEVTKNAPQQAIKNLGRAYANFFEDLKKYRRGELAWKRVRVPRFKKKGRHDSFRADNGTDTTHPNAVDVAGQRVKLPRLGWVRICEGLRFSGKVLSVVVSRKAHQWFASFTLEIAHVVPERLDAAVAGVDLGITSLATLADGTRIAAPKPLRRWLTTLKRLARGLSRKQRGSKNRAKTKTKVARLHLRIANIRSDSLHKLTTMLVTKYRVVGVEDLNVAGMLANGRLARLIADLGFFEFRRQLDYKAAMYGARIHRVSMWFPSSKLCSVCGVVNAALTLAERIWRCSGCEALHDRDINAAINLRTAASSAVAVCGAEGAGAGRMTCVKPAASKQKRSLVDKLSMKSRTVLQFRRRLRD